MALNPNELLSSASGPSEGRSMPEVVQPKVFKAGTGTLAQNAPVAYSTDDDQWVPYDAAGGPAGADTIRGLVWPDAIVLDSDEEVIGHVMLVGRAHIDDILAASSEADASIKADLQANARSRGLYIQGLVQVR